jgi:uncharacterized protein (TIGR03437 family)
LKSPTSAVVDASGNVYVADSGHNRIREISHGTITTLAGTGNCCYGGDGGAAGFAQLNAPTGLLLDASGRLYVADSGNNAVRLIQQTAAGAGPNVTEIANGASNLSGAITPGEVIVLFGSGLGPAQLSQGGGGAQVLINGSAAQIVYASAGQVSAVVPAAISGENAQIEVRYQGVSGASVSVPVAAASPALFTANASGTGQVLALNADGSLNGANNPAVPGTTVTLYLNGVPQQYLNGGLGVTIGPQQANIVNTNLPSPAPGVTAIAVQVPYGTSTVVAASISLQVGSFTSPTGVTLTVGGF